MPKSGKGEASNILEKAGWGHVSMSGILKRLIMRDFGLRDDEITRNVMFQGGAHYRKHFGAGHLAKLSISEAERLEREEGKTKIIIDGIRHPGEINAINKSGYETYFLGIKADKDPEIDKQIRLERLIGNEELRGAHFETASIFDWNTYLELDMPPHGLMVGPCLKKIEDLPNGMIKINGRDSSLGKWQDEIRGYAKHLELGYYRSPGEKK